MVILQNCSILIQEEIFTVEKINMDKENIKHRDIDGGYAWVILVAAFLCHGVGVGSREIFGIL